MTKWGLSMSWTGHYQSGLAGAGDPAYSDPASSVHVHPSYSDVAAELSDKTQNHHATPNTLASMFARQINI